MGEPMTDHDDDELQKRPRCGAMFVDQLLPPLDVVGLLARRPLPRSSWPPRPCPSLVERGTLTPRSCSSCATVHLALRFAPLDAPCRACVRALEERQPHPPGLVGGLHG
jgi:hypothetical protein